LKKSGRDLTKCSVRS